MKKLLCSLLLGTLVSSSTLFAAENDKIKHFGFSSIFGYGGETLIHDIQTLSDTEKVIYGTVIGSVPGLIKELTDDKYDSEDMAYNVAGAFAGSLLSNYLNNNVFVAFEHNSKRKSNKVLVSFKY